MKFESKYNIGQTVYVALINQMTFEHCVQGPFTIGQIRIEHTDSPGRPGETTFDNYMPQKDHKESYMLVETGVFTGDIYYANQLFLTYEEALNATPEQLERPQ